MFPTTLPSSQRTFLLVLLLIWAALLFGGFLLGKTDAGSGRRMPRWTRMASSLALVVAAWSWFAFSRGGDTANFALLLAVGMSFGFLGDLYMAGLIPVGQRVLGGIGAFGLGHISYIGAMLIFAARFGLDAAGPRRNALLIWLLIGLLGWYIIVFRGQNPTALHWAALPYALLLAGTTGVATGLALQAGAFIPLAVGAALFLISDLILAGGLFSGLKFPGIDDVVWLTYGPAQMLIVYSAGAALRWLGL